MQMMSEDNSQHSGHGFQTIKRHALESLKSNVMAIFLIALLFMAILASKDSPERSESTQTIEAAAQLIDLEFTESERELMFEDLEELRESYQSIRQSAPASEMSWGDSPVSGRGGEPGTEAGKNPRPNVLKSSGSVSCPHGACRPAPRRPRGPGSRSPIRS